ncbi:uncharacterized protein Z518_06706 [Rhinocladiella mackenziei CBS 650.93]|uniref:ABC-2 type transporter transmembrane domain-containing protein n=1 Tax=Rhinocladiella mackenziei CBS 650.93 TaxID=1442369 RepID=A0A0D2J2J5_9EURO|nr:uncharacterized protein Z518_06706 [Rhinocladiella mackenziei CBS 650.93]KIX03155.1 hypothetical protein Z518_06706 [Rhinocladiella mackenziei CBS 650.93]
MILALNPGGNPFYFGPVGENGSAVTEYFAERGTHCPPNKNVAEFTLETAAKGGTEERTADESIGAKNGMSRRKTLKCSRKSSVTRKNDPQSQPHPPTIVNGVVPKFYMDRALWEAREYPSRIYGWIAFCTAQVVAEIPMAIVASTVYWLFWYYPTNLPRDSSNAGDMFLMTMLFYLFISGWGQWICATYWFGGTLAATLRDLTVQCAPGESTLFNAPPGETCQSYARDFVQATGMGYVSTTSNGTCAHCPYATGAEYLSTLNIEPDEKWGDCGVFWVYVFTNWLLAYFFIYTVRVRKWSFGMGYFFGGLGTVVDFLARLLGIGKS